MSFINPTGLWFALLAVPIIIFYLLRIRRKEVEVSSTLLWRMALRDRQANAPWQKLRRNLLLLLQLLVLAALVLAAARLAFPLPAVSRGAVVLLIDGSASMRATDVPPTRFAAAIETAEALVRGSGAEASVAAVLVTHQPRILFTSETDRQAQLAALQEATPGTGEVDWTAALTLASGFSRANTPQEDLTFVILSDGGLPAAGSPAAELPPLPGRLRYVRIGESGNNLAISAFAVRTVPAGDRAELFAGVTNYGSEERAALLTLARDTEVLQVAQLRLPAGEQTQVVIEDLPAGEAVYTARLENIQAGLPVDEFPADDTAHAVLAPPSRRTALLVSEGNLFLEQLLLLLPNVEASRVVPNPGGDWTLPEQPFDLYILDGILPTETLPPGDLLLIHPPENPLFPVSGATTDIQNPRVTGHPLTQFLEWDTVNVFETQQIDRPDWAEVLVEAGSVPLVFIGETGGRRVAVVGFDLRASDLPLQVAFPILFANLFDYLAPGGMVSDPQGIRPNNPVTLIPGPGVLALDVTGPEGSSTRIENPDASVLFTRTGEAGVYQVRAERGDSLREAAFAVNLFSDAESAILPAGEIRIGQTVVAASDENEISLREIWNWLIFLAICVLLLEWLAYYRRLGPLSRNQNSGPGVKNGVPEVNGGSTPDDTN